MNTPAVTPEFGPTTNPTMKLLIDTASHRVLFAEAGKDVVDFLFGVLAMPVAALASMLLANGDDDALGGVGSLYASVEKMDAAYMKGANARDALVLNTSVPSAPSVRFQSICTCSTCLSELPPPPPQYAFPPPPAPQPQYAVTPAPSQYEVPAPPQQYAFTPPPNQYQFPAPLHQYAFPPPAPQYEFPPPPHQYAFPPPAPQYECPPPPHQYAFQPPTTTHTGISLQPPLLSDNGGTGLPPPMVYQCQACHTLGALQGSEGFVQGAAMYTVMDDLAVAPTSNMSSIALLNKLGIKDMDALEERTVSIGRKECLEILKVSLRSKTVLTDVFLSTNKRARTYEE